MVTGIGIVYSGLIGFVLLVEEGLDTSDTYGGKGWVLVGLVLEETQPPWRGS